VKPRPPFQVLIDEHRAPVLGFLHAMVGADGAEDCLQETFLAALRAYPKADDANLRGWLFAIARNKAIDHHRSRTAAPSPYGGASDLEGRAPAGVPAWLGGPPPGMSSRDGEVWEAVSALPNGQRAAVLLRFAVDLRYGEIGTALGCSEDAARRRVHDGLKTLRTGASALEPTEEVA
jgi:DNA-directed RNA polymerase specialized sigma24 family protein